MKKLSTLLLLFLAQFSIAQTISTDAPSVSAGASTVGKGIFQIETRLQYTRFDFGHSVQLPSNLFRFGIGNSFELRLTNGITKGTFTSPAAIPFTLGFKAELMIKPEGNTQMAFLMSLNRPDFEAENYGGNATLAVSHTLGDRNNIGYNVGFNYQTLSGGTSESFGILSSVIYSHNFSDKLTFFTELYGSYGKNTSVNTEEISFNFDTGFMYLVTDRFQIDYSYGLGISDEMTFHALGFNFMIGPRKKK